MPRLFVGNVDNEHMVGEPSRFTFEMRCTSSIVANRLLWLCSDGDAIVLPYRISEAFVDYVFAITGVTRSSTTVVVPDGGEVETQLLTHEVLSDGALLSRIRSAMPDPASWTLMPYYFDRSVAWLARELGTGDDARLCEYFRQGGAEALNSKVAFRRMAAAHDIPVPSGSSCSSAAMVGSALRDLIEETGAAIVKQDLNAGGDGNAIVAMGDAPRPLGAVEVISAWQPADLDPIAERLWTNLTGPRNVELVVETYYPDSRSFYSELHIAPGRRPRLLNFGEMRMEPVWMGFEIPCSTLGTHGLTEFLSSSVSLGEVARTMGYSGYLNCDAVLTKCGRVLFNEVNGRLGGCTHIHSLAAQLFGEDYANNFTLLTRNKNKTGPFEQVIEALDREGLLYTRGDDSGVIVATEDTERTGTLEYLIAAASAAEARELERAALAILDRTARS
jgi:hypothetical protein